MKNLEDRFRKVANAFKVTVPESISAKEDLEAWLRETIVQKSNEEVTESLMVLFLSSFSELSEEYLVLNGKPSQVLVEALLRFVLQGSIWTEAAFDYGCE